MPDHPARVCRPRRRLGGWGQQMRARHRSVSGRHASASLAVFLCVATSTIASAAPSVASSGAPEIIFSSKRFASEPEPSAIYRMPAEGGERVQLFSSPFSIEAGSLSPDGTKLVFVWRDLSSDDVYEHQPHIGVYDLSTAGPAQYFNAGTDDIDSTPVWSPDGATIAFSRDYDGEPNIWTMRADGSGQRRIRALAAFPSYSPSGKQIAFTDHQSAHLMVMNADGSNPTEVELPHVSTSPRWSPDGTRIAYYGGFPELPPRPGEPAGLPIYTVRARGGKPTLLYRVPDAVEGLAWSADSSTLYFAAKHTESAASLYSLPAVGGTPTRLTQTTGGEAFDHSPVFVGARPPLERIPPGPPTDLVAQPAGAAIVLSWPAPLVPDWSGVHLRQLEGSRPPGPSEGNLVYTGRSPAVVSVVAGRTYSYSAFSFDSSGNDSVGAATRTVRAIRRATHTVDDIITTGSATKQFRVSWNATDGTRFRISYAPWVKSGFYWQARPWRVWYADTAAKSGVFGAANRPEAPREGVTYVFRVQVRDAYGNYSFPADEKDVNVPLDDMHRAITYTGAWKVSSSPGNWLGTSHVTKRPGSAASVRAEGSAFRIVATTCPTCGKVRVRIDGYVVATVDTYSATTLRRRVVYTSEREKWIEPRTLRLEAVAAGSRRTVILDAIGTVL